MQNVESNDITKKQHYSLFGIDNMKRGLPMKKILFNLNISWLFMWTKFSNLILYIQILNDFFLHNSSGQAGAECRLVSIL